MRGYIVGIGAANIDVSGRSKRPIIMRDSNPGHMVTSCGGVTRNVLENLSRLGAETALITAVGDDLYGKLLIGSCRELGIASDRVLTVKGGSSSSYISVLDDRGDMLVALSDMSILERLEDGYLDSHRDYVRGAEAIVCDPSLPAGALDYLINDLSGDTPVYVDTVSTTYAKKLLPFVGGCDTIKPNSFELEAMTGVTADTEAGIRRGCDKLLSAGARRVVVSLGAEGCASARNDGSFIMRALTPVSEMKNATGAGDSLMAGLIFAHCENLEEEDALDYGMACGIASILSESTINPELSPEMVRRILRDHRI